MAPAKTVAIVGVGGEFPSSPTLERFWENIVNNVDTSREAPEGRWLLETDEVYDPEVAAADKVYSRKACFLDENKDDLEIDGLNIPADYLEALDPMFRLLLRVGQQTVSDRNTRILDRSKAGIIIGNLALPSEKSSQLSRYLLGQAFTDKLSDQGLAIPENPVDPINRCVAGLPAGILAKALGFGGTSFTVDAACASSLYAIKLAVDELISGRADAMLAGGLSRPDSLYTQMGFSQLRALSPSGTCSPFAAAGNGLVVGEGCGLVLLKRTEDAIRDGDQIYAVIRGIGLSNDLEGNLLAPASEGQLRAMQSAYKQAGWQPSDIDMVECHATGTPVGDKVEFNSLSSLWKTHQWRPGQCVIGSVKANIGHLLTAAGSAALIKTLLAMKHRILPPMVNFSEPAEGIDLERSPFRILNQACRWETNGEKPRRAAVSAFGFGGINAHLLVEEWQPQRKTKKAVASHPFFQQQSEPIAIVGMGSQFGRWENLDQFRQRALGDKAEVLPSSPDSWWGLEKSSWFKDKGYTSDSFKGFFVPKVSAHPGEFRIPPKEQEEMLPRQLLMLKIAAAALSDAKVDHDDLLFTGIYIGCGLDLNATNFTFRWGMQKYAPIWAKQLGLQLDDKELEQWITQLRNDCGPALNANRTMGALGSVVASRIAKNFRIGGPSFTLSSEENSGLRALEVAVNSLQEGSINRAIVGAVDLTGDLRNVISRHSADSYSKAGNIKPFDQNADGTLIGEGAAAVVLKRLSDARQDGDQIYAVIRGISTSIGGDIADCLPSKEAYKQSLAGVCSRSKTNAKHISFIETDGSGSPQVDHFEADQLGQFIANQQSQQQCHIGSVKADIGHAGAAAGLASVVKTALCLKNRILPSLRNTDHLSYEWIRNKRKCTSPVESQYWLTNTDAGRRQALVCGLGNDGSCSHAVLEEYDKEEQQSLANRPVGALAEGLFVVDGNSASDVLAGIARLKFYIQKHSDISIDNIAAAWLAESPLHSEHQRALSCISGSLQTLHEQLDFAAQSLQKQPDQPIGVSGQQSLNPIIRDRVFYSPDPLAGQGKIAFVFPGSGNHYAGMGRELSALWPDVYRNQEKSSNFLADQYQPHLFWKNHIADPVHENHNALVISHVALCTALHDLVRSFNIQPQMISGYSLGESAGLFSSGAWADRDGMLSRLQKSSLFTHDLAGECRAAQRVWGMKPGEKVDWMLGMVDLPGEKVKKYLKGKKQVYLLIVNTYRESVIGGQRDQVEQLVKEMGCHFIPLKGVTTVHCEVTKAVANAYRDLHLFDVTHPQGVDYYSCALGKKYPISRENSADVILGQALDTINYPKVIEQLYADQARIFLEIGPGGSCSRMINSILEGRPHMARSFCLPGQDSSSQVLRLLGHCLAERIPVDLTRLYPSNVTDIHSEVEKRFTISTTIGGQEFESIVPQKNLVKTATKVQKVKVKNKVKVKPGNTELSNITDPGIMQFNSGIESQLKAHEAYLEFSTSMQQALTTTINQQMNLLQQLVSNGESVGTLGDLNIERSTADLSVQRPATVQPVIHSDVAFDRDMCMEFAIGSVGKMLGPDFAEVDSYPTRVRLPDEPLMLVDRIMSVEGEPRSMTHGRVVTEHDVHPDRWYLDGGRIPTCVAVEAGQADLFLSGYLGIDFISKGNAVYRLLDAVVTFHRTLPVAGETIHYDIKIEEFFRQDQTYLFRFNFEGTVNGEPLLSMRNGCAGFFTAEELAAGKGIVHTKFDLLPQPGKRPADWCDLIPLASESYNKSQVNALYAGDLEACFGPLFANLNLNRPYTLPGGNLKLVDRVVKLDPDGGRYGIGQITAEMDIHPDDWFLTCHFVDDRVMPGTLMYECCLHTLRIYLLRMGWIGEEDMTWCEPVPGVASGLKCRGQVTESTRTVTYQVSIKEIGYRPEPFAIVDALMFADGHPVVEIPDMSVQLAGLNRERVEALWANTTQTVHSNQNKQILYDTDRITAFAIGNPSDAFGEPYKVFDQQRKIARLPGPPFQFLDRIVAIEGEPWKLVEGASVVAEYDVPEDAWYFAQGRQENMPFSVLLEIGLQPCGWLAAYLGSALTSPTDLSFRNLDGNAVQHRAVTASSGTLSIAVNMTRVASSGGMIIQNYDFEVSDSVGPIYTGDTVFGFFSKESLAQQVGVRGAKLYQPQADEVARTEQFEYPQTAPFPDKKMQMIDTIDIFISDGGPAGLGFIRGRKIVDSKEWFFKAHFYQDPVCPGSLGLESFLQLLKVIAVKRWSTTEKTRFENVVLGEKHSWNYRGQIIPANKEVVVEAVVTAIDDQKQVITADGFLSVDGKIIYQLKQFTLKMT